MDQFIVGGAGKNTHPTTKKGYSDHSTRLKLASK